jgi:putative SbcD/Mre11-related phosphoesterase
VPCAPRAEPGSTFLAHREWLLTPHRAAVHLPTATAVIADPHLGYDRVRRRGGEAVPRVGLDAVLAPLRAVAAAHEVRHLIIAGDLFEDGRVPDEPGELLDWFRGIRLELVAVVPGNHDRGLERSRGRLPVRTAGVRLGGWRVVHGDGRRPRGRVVQGHLHPCLRWGRLAAPCYLIGERHLVLPAFSADAAGGDVLGDTNWGEYRCAVIAGDRVMDFGEVQSFRSRLRRSEARSAASDS